MRYERFQAMGTWVELIVPDDQWREGVQDTVKSTILDLEGLLSRFRSDSELSQINHNPGRWVSVSRKTMEVLQLAKRTFEETAGFFNPCLAGVLESIGYDVSFDEIDASRDGARPVVELPYIPPAECPYELDIHESRVWLQPGYKLDLGGIAKSWIVQQAAQVVMAKQLYQFVLNGGGDMICHGQNGDKPWSVSIADPFHPEQSLLTLQVANLAVCTSGTYRRKWKQDGRWVHHIIDPFLGCPVETDIISCTVIHPDIVQAEVQAKVALMLGADEACAWLQGVKGSDWIIVRQTGEVIQSWKS